MFLVQSAGNEIYLTTSFSNYVGQSFSVAAKNILEEAGCILLGISQTKNERPKTPETRNFLRSRNSVRNSFWDEQPTATIAEVIEAG